MDSLKERYDEAKKRYLTYAGDDEAEEAFSFVQEVIGLEIERIKRDEPYAHNTLKRYKMMEGELTSFLDQFLEAVDK